MRLLTDDVMGRVAAGVLQDQHLVSAGDRRELLDEIHLIGTRLGIEGAATIPLDSFLKANPDTEYGKAVRQYCSHVAYSQLHRPVMAPS